MNHQIYFWTTFVAMLLAVTYFDLSRGMLRDTNTQLKPIQRPFSLASVQVAWWKVIILTSLITIIFVRGEIPTLNNSVLILLGISIGTTATAKLIDLNDMENRPKARHQNLKSEGLLIDLLSDEKGISLQRFQAVVLNLTFGFWFIYKVLENLAFSEGPINGVMPDIENNNLILLGLSSATYAAFKTTENRNLAAAGSAPANAGGNAPAPGGKANAGDAPKPKDDTEV